MTTIKTFGAGTPEGEVKAALEFTTALQHAQLCASADAETRAALEEAGLTVDDYADMKKWEADR